MRICRWPSSRSSDSCVGISDGTKAPWIKRVEMVESLSRELRDRVADTAKMGLLRTFGPDGTNAGQETKEKISIIVGSPEWRSIRKIVELASWLGDTEGTNGGHVESCYDI